MSIILALDQIRSSYNVGSLLRSAEGLGITSVISIGITPHMKQIEDTRLPHVITKAEKQISKTALGAESLMHQHFQDETDMLKWSRQNNFYLASLELGENSVDIRNFKKPDHTILLVLGNEVDGVSRNILASSDVILSIPMYGQKESFNVTVSGAIALYELTR